MRSFVTLFVATLFLAVVASGLMAFFLPFDQVVTRAHAVCAPLFSLIVGWHLFNNRKIFLRHLGSKSRPAQLAVAACAGGVVALIIANAFPVNRWLALSYEKRESEAIFRPPPGAVGRQLEGAVDVAYAAGEASLRLAVSLREGNDSNIAIWAEGEDGRLLDTLFVTERVAMREEVKVGGDTVPRAELLPVWSQRWEGQKGEARERADLDGVSAASGGGEQGFEAALASPSPRFSLMIELEAGGGGSQVYSSLVDLGKLKEHYLIDFLALGLPGGKLGYDTESLSRADLLIDRAILTITSHPTDTP